MCFSSYHVCMHDILLRVCVCVCVCSKFHEIGVQVQTNQRTSFDQSLLCVSMVHSSQHWQHESSTAVLDHSVEIHALDWSQGRPNMTMLSVAIYNE